MKKYRHRQPTYKKAKRLLNLLKYRRHKKIRESIFNSRKKLVVLRTNYNRLKHKYFLKKEKLGFYEIEPLTSWGSSLAPNSAQPRSQISASQFPRPVPAKLKATTPLLVAKKKYKIHSYLFNVICKFPRKYVYHFFGKDILRKYYTMPFRLNISRFISNKVLRSYYTNLSHKALLNLCQKASRGRGLGLPHAVGVVSNDLRSSGRRPTSFQRGGHPRSQVAELSFEKQFSSNFIVQKAQGVSKTESAERAKNFVLCLEERLDSTLLRLLHFKPLNSFSSVKRALSIAGRKPKPEANEIKTHEVKLKLTKSPKYQIKSPWSYFGAERVRQLISHGHIQVNGKKVKSPNTQIRIGDQIQIKGFIVNLAERGSNTWPKHGGSRRDHPTGHQSARQRSDLMKMNHLFTLLLRRFKDQTYLSSLGSAKLKTPTGEVQDNGASEGETQSDESQESEELLYNYIKGLKIKRFTEAFYMTYRNLHLIERTSSLGAATSWPEGISLETKDQDFDVEKHIQPVFETIGYNQSIYLLWPVISLLRSSSWGPTIKRNLIQSSTRALRPSNFVARGADQTRQGFENQDQQQNSETIKRKLQNLLKWKKLQTSAEGASTTQGSVAGCFSTTTSLPNRIRSLILQNPSWLYTQPRGDANAARGSVSSAPHKGPSGLNAVAPKSFRSYASIVYGTRKCKWIKLQQGSCGAKGSFYNQIPNHTQFFQLELEFFQSVYRGVHGHS